MPSITPPLWRYFLADLDGNGITDFSRLASNRVCEVVLNAPLSLSGTVPSDNTQVWLPYDGDGYNDPYLAEGTRLLWGFRRESDVSPYYQPRAATLCQFVEDTAEQDDASTRFVGWDPWHYMFSRPVTDEAGTLVSDLPNKVISWTATKVSVIVCELLRNTILNHGHAFIDAGNGSRSGEGTQYQDWAGTGFYLGDLSSSPEIDWSIAQGTSVGEAWQQLTDAGHCDIVLTPIYDPSDRPNYLVEMNVYVEAGDIADEVIFAWNLPSRSLVGLTRQEDGSGRANNVQFYAGQGGTSGDGTLQTDAASVTKYGQYWAQQFFPGVTGTGGPVAVTSLAQEQLALRARGRETVTFRPAPERSPRPWLDYGLGDRVQVWASPQGFRRVLGQQTTGTLVETQYQRIYGWTANISDEALETIDPVLTSPQGF